MKTSLLKPLANISLALVLSAFAFTQAAHAETSKLIIESGDSAQSKQQAAMEKEQWNDTRSLRSKVNNRVEKDFDKDTHAVDLRDKCMESVDINVYWEPNTQRCLDRRNGRVAKP
ncbi:DUF1283 family protein [Klebsiella sp. BIGb0407]|uniref:DUF1283 family protein n=1 Tax=Klebsiella sp. BIGb0407 TaxID=2940603 RepID=UPI002168240A|nr:DUF1283 family protein [Klebsiella sp. BIGb0407]MCS3429993.1 hypothetical protein [Klebsiella sp. BIGb0407]